MRVNQVLEKAVYRKVTRVKGVPYKIQWMDRPPISSIGIKKGRSKPMANTANNSRMFKTKRMLSEAWAELSPAHRDGRWKRKARRGRWRRRRRRATPKGGGQGEGGRGRAQVRRGKNPRPGESLDKDKRRDRQYNYEQARSTRHTGRLADFLLNSPQIFDTVFSWTSHPQPPAEPFLHIFHHPVTANIDAERSLTAATCQHCSFKTGDLVVVNLRHPREHWAAGLLPALSWPCDPGSRLPAVVVVDR